MIVYGAATILLMALFLTSVKINDKECQDLMFMDRSSTDALKGFLILLILLHHVYTTVSGIPHMFRIYSSLGSFSTAIFFSCLDMEITFQSIE